MPAESKKQRRFMGMVSAYKSGAMKGASSAVKGASKSMSKSQVDEFASTKEKDLPMKKGKKSNFLKVLGY